jgi:hypothetical protein
MSVPVDCITPIDARIGKECIQGTMLQLRDGSLYLICNGGMEVHPMDRSYAGMILKESIHQITNRYTITRRRYKEARYKFKKTGDLIEKEHMEIYGSISENAFTILKKMRRGWKKFKDKSTKKKRIIDAEEAARLKEAAMVAKRLKQKKASVEPDYEGFVKQYTSRCKAGYPMDTGELIRLGKRFHCLPDYEEGH